MMELRVEHLCKRYGENTVLDDISFTARVGVTRLLGPSGIGKTTLLRVLLGLETPDSGTVNGDKFRWTAVFQENRLLEGLDAEGNLRFVLGANYNAAAAQALDCRRVAEQRHDDLTVFRRLLRPHDDLVAVKNARLDHGIAAHLQEERA